MRVILPKDGISRTNLKAKATSPALASAEQRKKARRVSHSDIERRRRVKINEQFDALRVLVPKCAQHQHSVNLHKLDILQETVAYLRVLRACQPPNSPPLSPSRGSPSDSTKLRIEHIIH